MKTEKWYRVCAGSEKHGQTQVNVRQFIEAGETFYAEVVDGGLNLYTPSYVKVHPSVVSRLDRLKTGGGRITDRLRVVKALHPQLSSTVLILGWAFKQAVGLVFTRVKFGWEVRVASDRERNSMERNSSLGNVSVRGYFLFSDEEKERLCLNDPTVSYTVRCRISPTEGNYLTLTRTDGKEPKLLCRHPICKNGDMTDFSYVWKPSEYAGGFFMLPAVFRQLCTLGVTQLPAHFEEDGRFVIEGPPRVCPICGSDYSAFDTSASACPECIEKMFDELIHEI